MSDRTAQELWAEVLVTPMRREFAEVGAGTIGEYLRKLLLALWTDRDDFSGKRPFGSSLWEHDIYEALISAGLIEGVLDENGGIQSLDHAERMKADDMIDDVIRYATF